MNISIFLAVTEHLLQPFETAAEAESYWLETGSQLIIGPVPPDSIAEYTEALPDGYTISLVITSDFGGGIYYLTKEEI